MFRPVDRGGLAALCHYTYEVEQHSGGSNGQGTTTWDEHEFTVVQTDVDATGIDRLRPAPTQLRRQPVVRPHRLDADLDRVVELESSELEHEYSSRWRTRPRTLRSGCVFEPAFMVWCLDQAADELLVEIEDGVLVVAIPDHSYDADQLDALVEQATTIATRFADVVRAAGSSRVSTALIIVVAVVVLALLYVVITYNGMIRSRNMVDQGWSGIDVQLKRRHDLIPNWSRRSRDTPRTSARRSRP